MTRGWWCAAAALLLLTSSQSCKGLETARIAAVTREGWTMNHLLAASVAFHRINADPSMLPGVKLVLDRHNIQEVGAAEGPHAALKMCYLENVMNDVVLAGSLAVFGVGYSADVTGFMAPLVDRHNFLLMTHSAADSAYGNNTEYPNIARTCQNTAQECRALADVVNSIQHRALKIVSGNDAYNQDCANNVRSRAAELNIKVVEDYTYSQLELAERMKEGQTIPSEISDIVTDCSEAVVNVLCVHRSEAKFIMDEAHKLDDPYATRFLDVKNTVWIMNEWASSHSQIAGVLSIRFKMPGVEEQRIRDIRDYWLALDPADFPGYDLEAGLQSFLGTSPYPRFAFDAAHALGLVLDSLQRQNISLRDNVAQRNALRDVSFHGVSGFAKVEYDEYLDRTDADFTVVQYGPHDSSKSLDWLREEIKSSVDPSSIAGWQAKGKFISRNYQPQQEISVPTSDTCPERVVPKCLGVMREGKCVCSKGQSAGSPWNEPCKPCSSGTFNDVEGSDCRPCPIGSFSLALGGTFGPTTCMACKDLFGNFFQPGTGNDKCIECPAHTHKKRDADGIYHTDCECDPGFWRPDGQQGFACIPCPEGAICEGGPQMLQPHTKAGYWVKTSTAQALGIESGVERRTGLQVLAGFPFTSTSNSSDPFASDFDLPVIFFECLDPDSCLANNSCPPSQTGTMCGACAEGYYSFFDSCEECPGGRYSGDSTMLTILAWIIVIVLWNLMEILAETYPTMTTVMLYMQCLSIAQEFTVPWPDGLSAVMAVFAIADFDIGVVDPACVTNWDYYIATYFTLMLPFIFGFFSAMNMIFAYIWSTTVKRKRMMGITLGFFVETREELWSYCRKQGATFMSILVILYNELCKKSFQSFLCETLPDGVQFLTADPTVECGTAKHKTMIGVSCLFIIIYVLGIPGYFAYILYYNTHSDTLKTTESLELHGFLYLGHRPGLHAWSLVMLLRRFFLCCFLVFLSQWPHFQLACGLVLIITAICLQYHFLPYTVAEMNRMDCAALLSICQYLIIGFIFIADNEVSRSAEDVLVGWLLFTTILTMMLGCYYIYVNYRATRESERSTNELVDHTVGAWWKVTLGVRENMEIDEFWDLVGSELEGPDDMISPQILIAIMERAQVLDVVGHGMAHLMLHLLDADHNEEVSQDEAYEHLWMIPSVQQQRPCNCIIDKIDIEVEKKYFGGKWPSLSSAREANYHRSMTGEHFAAYMAGASSPERKPSNAAIDGLASSRSSSADDTIVTGMVTATLEYDKPQSSSGARRGKGKGKDGALKVEVNGQNGFNGLSGKSETQKQRICEECGQNLMITSQFCDKCGHPTSHNKGIPPPTKFFLDLQDGTSTPAVPCTPRCAANESLSVENVMRLEDKNCSAKPQRAAESQDSDKDDASSKFSERTDTVSQSKSKKAKIPKLPLDDMFFVKCGGCSKHIPMTGSDMNALLEQHCQGESYKIVNSQMSSDGNKLPCVNNDDFLSISCGRCSQSNAVSGLQFNTLLRDKMIVDLSDRADRRQTFQRRSESIGRHNPHETRGNYGHLPNMQDAPRRSSASSRSPSREGTRSREGNRNKRSTSPVVPFRNGSGQMDNRSSRRPSSSSSAHGMAVRIPSGESESLAMSRTSSFIRKVSTLDDEMFYRKEFVKNCTKGWHISKLFNRKVLRPWLQEQVQVQNIEMVLLLSLLNQWVSPYLSDSSDYGLNSYGEKCKYYRDMAQGTPYIIDFILDSPTNFADMDLQGVTDVVTALYKSRIKANSDVSLSEGMDFYYRSAFLAWMIEKSSPDQRSLARNLLSSIVIKARSMQSSCSARRLFCCKND